MAVQYTPAQKYREMQFQTADQVKLILAAYDASLRFCRNGGECMEKGDVTGKSQWLTRAYEVVAELHRSLKPVQGGTTILNALDEAYSFIEHQITRANVIGDRDALQNAILVLEGLRDAWNEIIRIKRESTAPQ